MLSIVINFECVCLCRTWSATDHRDVSKLVPAAAPEEPSWAPTTPPGTFPEAASGKYFLIYKIYQESSACRSGFVCFFRAASYIHKNRITAKTCLLISRQVYLSVHISLTCNLLGKCILLQEKTFFILIRNNMYLFRKSYRWGKFIISGTDIFCIQIDTDLVRFKVFGAFVHFHKYNVGTYCLRIWFLTLY